MLINLVMWIIFGALAGWVASIIMGTNKEQGGIANIVIGILGAIIGGTIARILFDTSTTGFNLTNFIVAVLGAILLIGLLRLFSGGQRGELPH